MKANINQSPIQIYSRIPDKWPARPRVVNYHNALPAIHYTDGWRDIVEPVLGANEKRGALYFNAQADYFTYQVLAKTPEDIEREQQAQLDSDVSAAKLNNDTANGQLMFQRFLAEIQRRFDKGQLTGQEAIQSAQLLYVPLLPLKDGQFHLAKANLNALSEPTNQKILAVLNLAKDKVNNYIQTT